MNILDLGCGNRKFPGAVGIDRHPSSRADVIHDLDMFPYPFADNEFDRVICSSVLEHLNDLSAVMEELWRITRNGARVEISGPSPSSRWLFSDPTHRRAFTSRTFEFFRPGSAYYGRIPTRAKFRLIRQEYQGNDSWFWQRAILRFLNRHLNLYESRLLYIYQTSAFFTELETIK
jgi:ubiquinone/menaquinone biosynthesis C-methylase UbiE